MNCSNCGNPVSPDTVFCTSCGQKIEAKQDEEPPIHTHRFIVTKVLIALLCVAVVVSACLFIGVYFSKKGHTSGDAAVATTEAIKTTGTTGFANASETMTGTTGLAEITETTTNNNDNFYVSIAEEFLTSLVSKDLKKTLDLIDIYGDNVEASMKVYSFLNTVDITSYEFVESQPDKGVFLVRLEIFKSGSALFQVGTSLWNLETSSYNSNVSLFRPVDKALKVAGVLDKKPTEFCLAFTECMNSFETMNDFNKLVPDVADTDVYSEFCRCLAEFLPLDYGENEVKRTDLERKAKSTLGITEVDFTKCSYYLPDSDTLYFGGRGGRWFYWSFSSEQYNPLTMLHTVVIDYYSDSAYILVAKKIQYVVMKNIDGSYRLLSTELLYDSGLRASGDIA